jgi:glycosyltransferase involved in cell wall biosynthesis
MKILHVVHTDIGGGASRAVIRLHQSLLMLKIDSYVLVQNKKSDNYRILNVNSLVNKLLYLFRFYLSKLILKSFFKTDNQSLHSLQLFSSSLVRYINNSDFDIIHLHWFQHEMLSISDIGKLNKPIVWTLHDMWPFCGCEHITDTNRHLFGYMKSNRPLHEKGVDFNLFTWRIKKKYWQNKLQLVAPSKWMAEEASSSLLFDSWPIMTIPNTLDTSTYKPISKSISRNLFNFGLNEVIILFGAVQGGKYYNKGFDLLQQALEYLYLNYKNLSFSIVVFGQSEPSEKSIINYPIKYMGTLNDDLTLALLYSASDMLLVPSRIESFCQTASESQSCGTPVVGFNTTGLRSTVKHLETGYLAEAFDIVDFARGILWVLEQDSTVLSNNARSFASENFDLKVVGKSHINLYNKILGL